MNKALFNLHTELKNSLVRDGFWDRIILTVRNEVIPYQFEALNDRIENADKSYCIENFRKAKQTAQMIRDKKDAPVYDCDKWCYNESNSDEKSFKGWAFQDSDLYKWLEAVSYSLTNSPDSILEKKADECIDLICSAQLENGYLDTLFIINDTSKIFTNLKDWHELYCFGHLTEAAVAYYNATGKDKLLSAACRFADLICNTFGEGKCEGYPGHEIAEMALVKLYHTTGRKEYLDCAKFFIDKRGTKPFYFDKESGRTTNGESYRYNQAHKPVREQNEATGHAVRGVYLYSGMADVAKETDDETLFVACEKIFDNIEKKKLYITGGIGSTADGEAFSFDYDLPNDLAYCETCASIGLIFFAQRMLEINPVSKYADIIERALYNTVLSGMSEDGKSFFYANALEVNPAATALDSRKHHAKATRQKWFGCACCPPNLARLISSIGSYCITQNDENIYINQFIGGSFRCKNAHIQTDSSYTENGKVIIKITPEHKTKLSVRIPCWCENPQFNIDYKTENGYAVFEIEKETQIKISFGFSPVLVSCSNRVSENTGKVAVQNGPFVYCAESIDNGKNLHLLYISDKPNFTIKDGFVIADGYRLYEDSEDSLYKKYEKPKKEEVKIKLLPYYRRGNRGECEMKVYLNI